MNADTHWRDSARRARFFGIDAYAALPILIFLMHMRLWTFLLSICLIIFFSIIEHFKFTLPVFFRWLKIMYAGNLRISRPWWRT